MRYRCSETHTTRVPAAVVETIAGRISVILCARLGFWESVLQPSPSNFEHLVSYYRLRT